MSTSLDLPPLALDLARQVLAHGAARLGCAPRESHPHRSTRDHLCAALRHIARALETTDCDAIDEDTGLPHAAGALGRLMLATQGVAEGRR